MAHAVSAPPSCTRAPDTMLMRTEEEIENECDMGGSLVSSPCVGVECKRGLETLRSAEHRRDVSA